MPADTERAVWIDLPRQRRPEFALFPHFSGIAFVRRREVLPGFLARDAEPRRTESEPLRRVRFLAHRVVALGSEPHRQDVVRIPRRLTPRRRQRDVQSHFLAI